MEEDVITQPETNESGFRLEFSKETWIQRGKSYYLSIPAIVHKQGRNPIYAIRDMSGSEITTGAQYCDPVSGDIKISIPNSPDTRFDGVVIVK